MVTPYKISRNNGTEPDKHIDCIISVKSRKNFTDPKEKVSQDEWEKGYEPTDEELENGVVNFYAHYVLADIDPDTGVETDFFGLPLMLCVGAAVLGCKNRKKEEDE